MRDHLLKWPMLGADGRIFYFTDTWSEEISAGD
jgi:hypothetical protein